jgi:hypothetical protein
MNKPITIKAGDNIGGFFCGLYIRPNGPKKKGEVHAGHAHYIDHATFVDTGSVHIHQRFTDGSVKEFIVEAPNVFPVPAECHHTITAMEDGTTWRCVFSVALADVDAVEGLIPYNMEKPE